MTRREVFLLMALAATLVWHVLWRLDLAINPPARPERVTRIAQRARPPLPQPMGETRPAPLAAARAPLSPFLWVRQPARPWGPPPELAAAPEPLPAMPPEPPEIMLPPWLFQAPVATPRPPERVSAEVAVRRYQPEVVGEFDDEAVELPEAEEWPPLLGGYERERYRQILDPFGLRTFGWVPRIGFPYWIWSEGLVYMPDYPPHHHHDTDYGYRLTPPR